MTLKIMQMSNNGIQREKSQSIHCFAAVTDALLRDASPQYSQK